MRYSAIVFVSISFLIGSSLFAQQQKVDPQSIISNILEDVSSLSDDEIDLDALVEDLVFFIDNPINLNTATEEQLGKLVFLSDFQILSLLDYVKTNAQMLTIYELQMVYGFDFNDVQRLLPFVTVAPITEKFDPYSGFRYGRSDLFVRTKSLIETQKGYTPAPESDPSAIRYAGSKMNYYTRFSIKTRKHLQAGFVAEKDPGEELLVGSPKMPDYFSFHAMLSDVGPIQTIVVGDFNAQFGQGLTMWTGTSFGKSSDVAGFRKRARGLNRYSSTDENLFLRGIGATVKLGAFNVTAFGSYKKIDASVSDTLDDGALVFSSRPTSGLHRTTTEIENRNTLGEFVAGGNLNTAWKNLRIGATASLVNLKGEFEGSTQLYRQYEPDLKNRLNVGADFNYGLGNHMLYGEVSKTIDHGAGLIAGGLFRIHPLLNLSLLGRSYQKNYSPYYTAALSDGSGAANEQGVVAALNFKPIKFWEVSGYADFFSSSWLKYGVSAPSRGQEYLVQASYSPKSSLTFNIRYRYKQKEKNQTVDTAQVAYVLPYNNQSFRLHCAFSPARSIELKSRIEFSWYNTEGSATERGVILYQDISYRPERLPLVLSARFAIFDTDSWDTRIYAYESDLLYSFSIPAYYSQGTRFYLLAKYSFSDRFDFWIRYSQTYFANVETIGTGLDEIDGPTRSDIKAQIRIKF